MKMLADWDGRTTGSPIFNFILCDFCLDWTFALNYTEDFESLSSNLRGKFIS